MKTRFGSKLVAAFAVLGFLLVQAGDVAAYALDWVSIQYRVYENGDQKNRLALDIKDDSGAYITSANPVTGVVLKGPGGTPVQMDFEGFNDYDYVSARFESSFFSWVINDPIYLSDFSYDILEPLSLGQYTLEVTMDDGSVLTRTVDYANMMDLAYVPSATFQIQTDPDGNIFWTWDTPSALFTTAQTTGISIRAGVVAYTNGVPHTLYWPKVSIEMGHSYIPNYIYNDMASKSDEIVFTLQVRTNDNQSRAYSNAVTITDMTSPVAVSPNASASGVTINQDFSLFVPNAALSTPVGDVYLDIVFSYLGENSNGEHLWTLENYSLQ